MKLEEATWKEVDTYLQHHNDIIIPTGSTEQHGPMGLIGTDAICASHIANGAGKMANIYVAPTLAYTPAPFNMAFPGTMSISQPLFKALVLEIVEGLMAQGFKSIYFLNGHGANLEPLHEVQKHCISAHIRIKSWWEFDQVNQLRQRYYGDWEGMHATPSEISITQATHRTISPGEAADPPKKLSLQYMKDHSGDRHGPPDQHRQQFPDGRVGSHSALATPEHGHELLEAAALAVAEDITGFRQRKN